MASRRAVKSTSSKQRRTGKRVARTRSHHPAKPVKRAKASAGQIPAPPPPAANNGGNGNGNGSEKAQRFDARLDRRIIEGMLHDRAALMAEMDDRGIDDEMVLRRAAELGLSEALIRQVKGVAADLAGERPGRRNPPAALGARTCLCCDRVFLSAGPGNRLCMRCRGGDAGLAQL